MSSVRWLAFRHDADVLFPTWMIRHVNPEKVRTTPVGDARTPATRLATDLAVEHLTAPTWTTIHVLPAARTWPQLIAPATVADDVATPAVPSASAASAAAISNRPILTGSP